MSSVDRLAIGVAVTAGATLAMGPAAQADDLLVTTTDDNNGPSTLRTAIETANLTPATEDRILFQSGLTGTMALGGSLPTVTGPLKVEGPGPDKITIDAGHSFNNFLTSADLSVSGLKLVNGDQAQGGGINAGLVNGLDVTVDNVAFEGSDMNQGGGISINGGNLNVTDSTFSGNTAETGGAIYAYSSIVNITGSTFTDNKAVTGDAMGGAVQAVGLEPFLVAISDSTFTGNEATDGGALHVATPLTVDSSLFSANTASFGAGLSVGTGDSGTTSPEVSIVNSTIAGNVSVDGGAGILSQRSTLSLESSTITGNKATTSTPQPNAGDGIFQSWGTATLSNSIVSGNTPNDFGSLNAGPAAGFFNASFSLIGNKGVATVTETVPGSNINSTAPQLGALASNGGATKTMLPANTSPVVNKGKTSLTKDQRGLTRPIDFNSIPFSTAAGANGADIGAVELQGGPPPPPTCATDPSLCPKPPSNNFNFGKLKLNKKKGVATLQVKVPGKGTVLLLGSKVVKKQKKSAKKKSTITLTIKAKGKAAKQLKKKGKAKVKAKVKFTPSGGKAKTKSKTVKLVKKKKKKK